MRVEIANHLNEHQKLLTDPSQLLITSGAQQGIDLIAQTLIKPGDIVLVESPCYSAALDIFINKGARIIPVSLDNYGIRSDLIDDICQSKNPVLLYTNPTFQNPTGTVMSKERRMELIELAELYEFLSLKMILSVKYILRA